MFVLIFINGISTENTSNTESIRTILSRGTEKRIHTFRTTGRPSFEILLFTERDEVDIWAMGDLPF
jgi:hypothetical protein